MNNENDFKKEKIVYLVFLLASLALYFFSLEIDLKVSYGIYFLLFLIQNLFFKRICKFEKVFLALILICISILNKILISNETLNFHIRLSIILMVCFEVIEIYYIVKSTLKLKVLKIIGVILLIPLIIGLQSYSRKGKIIKDAYLERALETKMGYKVTLPDLATIERFHLWKEDNVYDLEGIQYLKNANYLSVYGRGVKNLSRIKELHKLYGLSIYGGRENELSAINGMKNLKYLKISHMKEDKGFTLEKFPNLKTFSIQGVDLKDLSIVKNLKSVEDFSVSFNDVESMDGIEYLTKLKSLGFFNSNVKDVQAVTKLKNLKEIYIADSKISDKDMEKLKKMPNVKVTVENRNKDLPK